MRLTREFYVPSKYEAKIAAKDCDAVAYLYQTGMGDPAAMIFIGKRAKPEWRFRYANEEKRAEAVSRAFKSRRAALDYKAQRKAENKARGRGIEVGHVLVSSWGYDQTNIDWYVVNKLIGSTMAEIQEIGAMDAGNGNEPWMTGKSVPDTTNKRGKPFRVKVADGSCRVSQVAYAHVWDGRPRSWTAYA